MYCFVDEVRCGVDAPPYRERKYASIEIYEAVELMDASLEEREGLREVLIRHRRVFTTFAGRFSDYEYTIAVNTKDPITKKPYPIPLCYRDKVRQLINNWVRWGVLGPNLSRHQHPLVAVMKKVPGDIRMCLDLT